MASQPEDSLSRYQALESRVRRLAEVFDLDAILSRELDSQAIQDYYSESSVGYSLFHSSEGSIHMELKSSAYAHLGKYDVQPQIVLDEINRHGYRHIVELGSGKGFNLEYIAERAPQLLLTGLDLSPHHTRIAARVARKFPGVTCVLGDFELIPSGDSSVELCYSIESLCHARDVKRALAEAARVTVDRGRLIVIDAWRTDVAGQLDPDSVRVLELTERAMGVGSATDLRTWLDIAESVGWILESQVVLDSEVLPNLERFESLSARFLSHPRLARVVSRLPRRRLFENVVAGYLMAETVRCGLHTYRVIRLGKALPSE